MAKDRREDAGQFYPGGSVIPRGPVTTGGGTGGGSEPADYPTVRDKAKTGATHASATGNPHGTTAAQIPIDQGADQSVTKVISDMIDRLDGHENNGQIHVTDEQKAKWNSKQDALTTQQMLAVDSGITAPILREINAKLTKVDDIDDKRDKTDNICAVDGYGDFTFSDGIYRKLYKSTEVEHSFSTDGSWTGNEQPAEGVYYLTFYPENKTLYLQQDGGGHPVCTVERTKVAASGESYATTAGVRNIVSSDTGTRTAITRLAEAACADNPSASVASLDGRVVPCVSGASGTVDVSFAARKDGDTTLRFFDVLIKDVPSGGCEINLPPTESFIYGNALKAEEGWNHYSFAEFKDGDTYKWAVNRVKMSTSQS